MRGITIQLCEKTQIGIDELNRPVYDYELTEVGNVLVGQPSSEDIESTLSLYGKKVAYTLAIPKGDTHKWEDTEVYLPSPFHGRYKTIGYPTAGIESLIPLDWNKKVHIERYG